MKRIGWLVLLAVVGVGGFAFWKRSQADKSKAAAPPAERSVPVTTATAIKKDFRIYLDGLGTVTALQTVTVKTQVDGVMVSVGFKEGQLVKKGDLLAQIDPRPFEISLHQAQASMIRDSAQFDEAKVNLARYQDLVKTKLIPQQQVDDQRALVGQYEGSVKSDQAAMESAKLQLDYAHITAPLDGVTGIRLVDPGNVVHAADPTGLVVITPLDPIAVILTLPEDDLPQIAQGMADGTLTVQALSRDGSVHLGEGEITVLDNQINQATASLRLKAVFPNPKHLLWPNQFVKTRVLLQTRKNALVVASSAIQRGPQGTFIYVVDPNQTVSVKPVDVELVQDEVALLSNGLEGGETIVLDGQDQLKAGSKVAPRGSGHSETSRAGRASEAGPTR